MKNLLISNVVIRFLNGCMLQIDMYNDEYMAFKDILSSLESREYPMYVEIRNIDGETVAIDLAEIIYVSGEKYIHEKDDEYERHSI